jgi:hypothetical protein
MSAAWRHIRIIAEFVCLVSTADVIALQQEVMLVELVSSGKRQQRGRAPSDTSIVAVVRRRADLPEQYSGVRDRNPCPESKNHAMEFPIRHADRHRQRSLDDNLISALV